MRTLGSIFDREVEIARIGAAIDAGLRDGGSCVYVEGHAGIGKTRLLDVAGAHAAQRGARVLTARGGELERDYSYGIVRQLFEGAVVAQEPQQRAELLGGPAAPAALAIGLGPEPAASPDSPFPVVHGLYWLTANLAAREPLVLLLDDVHWADAPSLRFVDYLAGRLEGLPVSVVLAARPAEPDAPAELLGSVRDGRRPALVQPAPLGEQATAALLRERYGSEPDAAFVTACQRSSAGNPFLLHELVDALRRDGVEPGRDSAASVGDTGPSTVSRSLLLRLGRMAPEAAAVVDAVAVFGRDAEVRHVAAATGLEPTAVSELADVLADANVLDAARPLRFVHPVVRQAVYAQLRPAVRAALHMRAAVALTAERQPAEQVARHLLMLEPAADQQTVAVLRAAAAEAVAKGAADVAVPYLRRALDEPPAADARADLLAELGLAEALAGQELALAGERLVQAAALTEDPVRRADRVEAAARTRLYCGDLPGAVDLLEGAREGVDADTGLRLTAHAAGIGLIAPPLAAAAVARLEELGDVAGETPAELAALAELAGKRWLAGEIEAAADLAQRALADDALLRAEGPLSVALNHALRILVDADRHDAAAPIFATVLRTGREQGSLLAVASLHGTRAIAAWRSGDVPEAEGRAREGLDLLELCSTPVVDPAYWAHVANALVERGDLAGAEEAVERSGVGPLLPPLTYLGLPFHARARLRLAQGRPREALADLLELRDRDERLGVRHLSVAWHRAGVEAALAVGDADLARAFADDQLERVQRWTTPAARGLALSTKGLASGGEDGLALLEEGAAVLAGSPARLDHARALVDLGSALRRAGRPAQSRDPLRAGLDAARACGATALAQAAHAELVVAGAKPRRLSFSGADALTAGERRVARLAADGHSNREIAASLYITVRTVENHLARSYRKLGIGSRRELASALV